MTTTELTGHAIENAARVMATLTETLYDHRLHQHIWSRSRIVSSIVNDPLKGTVPRVTEDTKHWDLDNVEPQDDGTLYLTYTRSVRSIECDRLVLRVTGPGIIFAIRALREATP